jgi:hypothetical protein
MPRVGDVFQLLSGTLAVPNTTIQSAPYNAQQNDWVTEANSPRPISAGGTGETTAGGARTELGAIGVDDLAEADTKAAVVETDSVVIIDSEDANTNKRWLVSDLNAYMRTISPPTGLNRNRLVNGAFQINQENPGAAVSANGAYPADQWKITSTVTPGVIACERRTDGDPYALRLAPSVDQPTVSSGVWHISQTLEGTRTGDFAWGSADGKPAVLRVRVRASQVGTYGFFIRNNPATHTYAGSFTIGSGETARVVEKVIPIPAPPAGTWATTTAAGITVGFTMAARTADLTAVAEWNASSSVYGVTGQLNFIGSVSNELFFHAVALYSDPDSTGVAPKWEMPDEAEELRACERYYQKDIYGGFSGNVTSGSGYYAFAPFKTTMRLQAPAVSGASQGAPLNFPSTIGTLSIGSGSGGSTIRENRTASVTGNGNYLSMYVLNARL